MVALAACSSTSHGSASPTHAATRFAATPTAPTLAPPQPGSYAALGASETYGVGAEPHTFGYAYLVDRTLHARHFVSAGIPGATLNAAYQTELNAALAIRPSLSTVFFGFNDLSQGIPRDAFLRDLHDFVATLRRAHAQVLIIGLPDLSQVPAVARHFPESGQLHQVASDWNGGMKRVARQTGAHFLDLRLYAAELAAHPEYISSDGLHPSNAGHRALAEVVLTTIRALHLWSNR